MPQFQILPKEQNPVADLFRTLGQGVSDIYQNYTQTQDLQRGLQAAQQPGLSEYDRFQAILSSNPMGAPQQQQQIYQTLSGLEQQQRQNTAYQQQTQEDQKRRERLENFRTLAAQKAAQGQDVDIMDVIPFVDNPKDINQLLKESVKAKQKQAEDVAVGRLMASDKWQTATPYQQSQMLAQIAPTRVPAFQREQQLMQQERKADNEMRLKVHQESEEYRNSVLGSAEKAEDLDRAADDMQRLLDKGEATTENPWNMVAALIPEGPFSGAIKNRLMTEDAQVLRSLGLQQVIGHNRDFGYNFTDRDLALILDKVAEFTKTRKANHVIIALERMKANLSRRRAEIMNEIVADNGGYAPINVRSQVETRLKSDPLTRNSVGTAYKEMIQRDAKGNLKPGKWYTQIDNRGFKKMEFVPSSVEKKYPGIGQSFIESGFEVME